MEDVDFNNEHSDEIPEEYEYENLLLDWDPDTDLLEFIEYYTFDAMVGKLKEQGVTLTYDQNTLLSTVETKRALRLRRLRNVTRF